MRGSNIGCIGCGAASSTNTPSLEVLGSRVNVSCLKTGLPLSRLEGSYRVYWMCGRGTLSTPSLMYEGVSAEWEPTLLNRMWLSSNIKCLKQEFNTCRPTGPRYI